MKCDWCSDVHMACGISELCETYILDSDLRGFMITIEGISIDPDALHRFLCFIHKSCLARKL